MIQISIQAIKKAFELLELCWDPAPTISMVKEAYRSKAKLAHSDKGGSDEEFKQVNYAYRICKAIAKNGGIPKPIQRQTVMRQPTGQHMSWTVYACTTSATCSTTTVNWAV